MGALAGPMIIQIVFYSTMFAFLVIAIALGASGLQKANDAMALAQLNEALIARNTDAVVSYQHSQANNVPPPAAPPAAPSTPLAPPPAETAAQTPPPTLNPTPKPTPQPTTDAPTETHPLDPQWFHVDHAQYQAFASAEANADHHSHLIAGLLCMSQNRDMCPYDAYCPNGKANPPFRGGPPKIGDWQDEPVKQWSPYMLGEGDVGLDGASGGTWVQVGMVPTTDGGFDANGHGSCYTWDDWNYGAGGDIEDDPDEGEEHRRWILCCANEFTNN